MLKETLPDKLKKARAQTKMTAAEAGKKIGKSGKTISAWENGRAQPNADDLKKLSQLYEIGISDLFYEEGDEEDTEIYTKEERQIIDQYRRAPAEVKETVRFMLNRFDEKEGAEQYTSAS